MKILILKTAAQKRGFVSFWDRTSFLVHDRKKTGMI